jgi:hypothetical protein
MAIYLFNILSIPVYGFLFRNKRTFSFVAGMQLFLILACRGITVGMDLGNYLGGFQYIRSLTFLDMLSRLRLLKVATLVYPYSYESGYVVLNWLIGKLGLSFHGFLVLCAAFVIFSIIAFIYRYSQCPWISLVLFIGFGSYGYTFGILRQTLAMCIMLWCVPAAMDKKWGRFAVLAVVAFTVHRTSLLLLPLFLLKNVKINRLRIIICLCVNLVLLILAPFLYNSVIKAILLMLGKATYTVSSFQLNNQIIFMLLVVVGILLLVDMSFFEDSVQRLILWALLLSLPLEILGMCNDVFARAVEYYFIFMYLLIPNIMPTVIQRLSQNQNNRKALQFLLSGLIVVCMTLLMVRGLQASPLLPYKTFF